MKITALAIAAIVCFWPASAVAAATQWFDALGGKMAIVVSGSQTHGASSSVRMEIPPAGGPPAAHIHSREDETFVVVKGSFRFWHGRSVVDAGPGSVVFLPRNEPHQFRNVGTTTGDLICTIMPAGFERFFLEIGKRHLTLPKDQREFMKLSKQYRIRYAGSLEKPH